AVRLNVSDTLSSWMPPSMRPWSVACCKSGCRVPRSAAVSRSSMASVMRFETLTCENALKAIPSVKKKVAGFRRECTSRLRWKGLEVSFLLSRNGFILRDEGCLRDLHSLDLFD